VRDEGRKEEGGRKGGWGVGVSERKGRFIGER